MRGTWILVAFALVALTHSGSALYLAHAGAGSGQAAAYPLVNGDPVTYAALAENLAHHGVFSSSPDLAPSRDWPPGYPAVLAASLIATGSFIPVVLLQILFALIAAYLIYRIAARYASPALAVLAALLFGIEPSYVLANTTILSDGLFASLLVITIYFALFADVRGKEVVRWGTVGLMLGLLTLIRPIAEFLIPSALIALALIVFVPFEKTYIRTYIRRYIPAALALVIASLAVLAPWAMRNHALFGQYEVAHVGASNLLHYNAREFLVWRAGGSWSPLSALLAARSDGTTASERVSEQLAAELAAMTPEGERTGDYEGALAMRVILADPLRYAYFHLVNTAPFFIGSGIAAYEQVAEQVGQGSGYYAPTSLALLDAVRSRSFALLAPVAPILAEMLLWMLATLFAIYGTWKLRHDPRALVLALLILYFALITGPVAIPRYRIPAEPFILVLAAAGISALRRSRRSA